MKKNNLWSISKDMQRYPCKFVFTLQEEMMMEDVYLVKKLL